MTDDAAGYTWCLDQENRFSCIVAAEIELTQAEEFLWHDIADISSRNRPQLSGVSLGRAKESESDLIMK